MKFLRMNEIISYTDPRADTIVFFFQFLSSVCSDGPSDSLPPGKGHWNDRPGHDWPDQIWGVRKEMRSCCLRFLSWTPRLLEKLGLQAVGQGRAQGRPGQDHNLGRCGAARTMVQNSLNMGHQNLHYPMSSGASAWASGRANGSVLTSRLQAYLNHRAAGPPFLQWESVWRNGKHEPLIRRTKQSEHACGPSLS